MSVAVTGIKPTGTTHLGNYLGMIRPALDAAKEHDAFYFIADAHALTTLKDPEALHALTNEVAATWLALGSDTQNAVLYRQSDVPEVFELAWILSCVTPKGLLNRAHAYKAAVDANRGAGRDPDAGVNAGLFGYPVLMAADILLLGADVVPVGLDQKQHLEVARDIATSFNTTYGGILTVPEAMIDERVQTIPGTDGRKMSKSYGNVVPLLEPSAALRTAVMRIVTDSRGVADLKDPTRDIVFGLYELVAAPGEVETLRARYLAGGIGYGEAKQLLFDELDERFRPARAEYRRLMSGAEHLNRLLLEGAAKVRKRAAPLMERVRRAVLDGSSDRWPAGHSAPPTTP